jgi:IS30 family transposase
MDKSLAMKELHAARYSERRIAETLNVSRGAVRRHLAEQAANSTRAQTGPAQTGSDGANSTKAQTGSDLPETIPNAPTQANKCEPFREVILEKLQLGLSAKRIYQDLVAEHGFEDRYWSVYRFVRKLTGTAELPFRRIEVEPGAELQVDFGTGAKIRQPDGTHRPLRNPWFEHRRTGMPSAAIPQ